MTERVATKSDPMVLLVVKHGPLGTDGQPEWVRAVEPDDVPWDISNIPNGTELVDNASVIKLLDEIALLRRCQRALCTSLTIANDDSFELAKERNDLRKKLEVLQGAFDQMIATDLRIANERWKNLETELKVTKQALVSLKGERHDDQMKTKALNCTQA